MDLFIIVSKHWWKKVKQRSGNLQKALQDHVTFDMSTTLKLTSLPEQMIERYTRNKYLYRITTSIHRTIVSVPYILQHTVLDIKPVFYSKQLGDAVQHRYVDCNRSACSCLGKVALVSLCVR